jgi:hypothetical protein
VELDVERVHGTPFVPRLAHRSEPLVAVLGFAGRVFEAEAAGRSA